MFPKDFRTRLVIGTALWIIVGQSVNGFVLVSILRGAITSQFDHDLSDHTQELAALVHIDEQLAPVVKRDMSDPRFLPTGSGLYWQVQLQNGKTLRSPSLQDTQVLPSGPEMEELPADPCRRAHRPDATDAKAHSSQSSERAG